MKIARSILVMLFQEMEVRSNFKTNLKRARGGLVHILFRKLMQMLMSPLAWPGLAPLAAAGSCTEQSEDMPGQSHTARVTSGTTEHPSHMQPPCQTQDPPDRAPARQTRPNFLLTWLSCRTQDARAFRRVRGTRSF